MQKQYFHGYRQTTSGENSPIFLRLIIKYKHTLEKQLQINVNNVTMTLPVTMFPPGASCSFEGPPSQLAK